MGIRESGDDEQPPQLRRKIQALSWAWSNADSQVRYWLRARSRLLAVCGSVLRVINGTVMPKVVELTDPALMKTGSKAKSGKDFNRIRSCWHVGCRLALCIGRAWDTDTTGGYAPEMRCLSR